MPWGRLDDDFWRHEKVQRAGPLGLALLAASISYCNDRLTDGFIADTSLWQLMNCRGLSDEQGPVTIERVAERLVEAGLWQREPGGFSVHHFLHYNKSRAEVQAEREEAERRKAEGRARGYESVQRGPTGRFEPRPDATAYAASSGDMRSALSGSVPPLPGPVPVPGPGEEPGSDAAASGADAPPESPPPTKTPKKRTPAHAEEYAALREACRVTPDTESAWRGELNFAAKKLAGWSRDAILDGTAEYRRHYPGAEITPAALAKWLPRWRSPPDRAPPPGNGQVTADADEDYAARLAAHRAAQQALGLPTTPREWQEYHERRRQEGGP